MLLVVLLFFVIKVSTEENLRRYTIINLKETVKHSNVLIGLDPKVNVLLLNLKWLYRNENLQVGVWDNETNEAINWETKANSSGEKLLAFYKKETGDRNCLLKPNFFAPLKAHHVTGDQTSLNNAMDYLNNKCFTFVNLDGDLNIAGKTRQNILEHVYKVPPNRKNMNCERISVPSTKDFVKKYLYRSKPVIIENAMNDWPALSKWSNDFLRHKYGDIKVHVKLTPNGEFEGCDEAKKFDNFDSFSIPMAVRQQLKFPDVVVVRPAVGNVKFSEFLDMVENKDGAYNFSAYLEYSSIREYFPELKSDLKEMNFIDGLLHLSNLNIWLSNGKTLGKLHFDPFDNFLCQLRGNKRLTLFDPHYNYNLYEAHIQEAMLSYDFTTKKFRHAKLLDSTSMVMSPVDILKPNYERYPNFTRANSMECYLNEGDVLYMPSFWWHEVQSYPNPIEKRNLAVNFWYEPFLNKEFPCEECKLDVNPLYKKLLNSF